MLISYSMDIIIIKIFKFQKNKSRYGSDS